MTYVSGSGGLWSTLDDYLAFARLFLGDGAVDGVRLLRPETLKAMMTNQLTEDQRARGETLGMPIFTAHGFGYGLAVVMDPDTAAVTRCKGGLGTVGWPGAYGGWWQADPTTGTVMIFLVHNVMELEQMAMGIGLGVYGAITEFHGLATAL
jgi:CubicO group peptidase (beta-lactamase class C family)